MPYMEEALNPMLEALATKVKDVSCWFTTAIGGAPTWTGTGKVLTSSAPHGLSVGELIVLNFAGGVEGLKTGWIFCVKAVGSSTTIEVTRANVSTGPAWEWTGNVSAGEVLKLTEDAETRAAVTWTTTKGDATAPVATIALTTAEAYDYIGFDSAVTAGVHYAFAKVTHEALAAAGSVEIKKSDLDLLGV